MLKATLIKKARGEDMATLIELDALGLLVGAGETAEQYADRLENLRKNLDLMEQALATDGTYEVDGMVVEEERRIPQEVFTESQEMTKSLYGFAMNWVPGFFITPPGLFFGGCAFHFFPDFFALFIIRESFSTRERWLIYDRRELLAHELCHVGRIGLGSLIFEETFAYQTAGSTFRKLVGGVFRSPKDSFLFLGSTLLLLACQLLQSLVVPRLWIWPFWLVVGATIAFLSLRHLMFSRQFRRARLALSELAPDSALKILFRCTDNDVHQLAKMTEETATRQWLEERREASLRWRITWARFLSQDLP